MESYADLEKIFFEGIIILGFMRYFDIKESLTERTFKIYKRLQSIARHPKQLVGVL